MTADTKTILCGPCRVPVKGPTNPNGNDAFSCPSCGNSDTFDNVVASVKAFVTEVAGNNLQETVRKVARGNKFIKATLHPIPKGTHPFFVDMKM